MPRSRKLNTQQLTNKLGELVQQANAGQPGARERLHEFLEQHPQMWEQIGSLGAAVERDYLALLCKPGDLSHQMLLHQQKQVREELLGKHPTAMERALVEVISINRLSLYHALQMAAEPGATMTVSLQRSRRAEIEQRRFLQAMRTLATLRELLPKGLAPTGSIKLYKPPRQKRA